LETTLPPTFGKESRNAFSYDLASIEAADGSSARSNTRAIGRLFLGIYDFAGRRTAGHL
jgi:hypothetical protein